MTLWEKTYRSDAVLECVCAVLDALYLSLVRIFNEIGLFSWFYSLPIFSPRSPVERAVPEARVITTCLSQSGLVVKLTAAFIYSRILHIKRGNFAESICAKYGTFS